MERKKEQAKVLSQEMLADGIYSLWIETEAALTARPGQFVSVYTTDASKLLPRPISICEIDKEAKRLRLVYRVTGEKTGTKQFSELKAGDFVPVIGPLGNGFPYVYKRQMLRAIKAYAEEKKIECYISLEERMACGIGACLACVCKTKEKDAHSNVNNKRICKDGPVFLSTEVDL